MNYVTELLTSVNNQVDHYTFDGYHAVISTFSSTITTLLVIYFAGLGWMVIRGLIPLTPMAVAWHMLKAAFVVAFALHWDYFSFFFVNLFLHGPDRVMGMMFAGSGPNGGASSLTQNMAHFWETGNNIFAGIWRTVGADFLLGNMMGLIGFLAVTAVTGIALFYLIMSKVALSILLILAPIILPMYLWETTRNVCNRWLQLLIQWAITPLFLYAFLGLFLKPLQMQVTTMANAATGQNTASIATFVLLALVVCAVLKQAGSLSSSLSKTIKIGNAAGFGESVPYIAFKSLRQRGSH